jgi:tetratricopeptide (TPR) repeat protein
MTEMINLIVPPIIIVFTVAIFLYFLAKNLSSSSDGGSFVLKKNKNDAQSNKVKKRNFLKKKRRALSAVFQEKKEDPSDEKQKKNVFSDGEDGGVYAHAQSSAKNGNKGEKIVSLRKKSMVSDKIENAQGRDPIEIGLMQEIEAEPHNSKKYEQLGDYYMEHEQFEDARECYKYVLRLDPRHKRAQVAMRNLDRVLN